MNNKIEISRRPSIIHLFLSFLRLGLTAFGGPAMIAYIKELSVNKNKWIDEDSFKHGLALCQTLPGPMVVNTAAYIGLRLRGLPGMLACFVGFLLPAFLMLLAFSIIYHKAHNLPAMISVFEGLQVIVVAIILNATLSFGKGTLKQRKDVLLAVISATVLLLKVNPFFVIIGAALVGIIAYDIMGSKMPSMSFRSSGYFKDALILFGFFVTCIFFLLFLNKRLFDLALVMPKIVLFSFGGGYGALPLMFHEVVEAKAWLDSKTFMDGVALGQITPGPILINATFIGYLLEGVLGSVVGTLAVFFPGLILVTVTLPFFDKLKSSRYFMRATRGILASFVGLLLFVAIKFALAVPWDVIKVVLGLAALTALVKKVDILYVVLIGAVISVFIF